MRRLLLCLVPVIALAACSGNESPTTLTVVGTEMAFAPTDLSVADGNLVIQFDNDGTAFHEIAVEQGGRALGRVSAPPGQSASLELNLDPGTYELTCREPGHYEGGMKGSLRVGS
jgi:uncharacterized cupredoxin-like copper-binding protein